MASTRTKRCATVKTDLGGSAASILVGHPTVEVSSRPQEPITVSRASLYRCLARRGRLRRASRRSSLLRRFKYVRSRTGASGRVVCSLETSRKKSKRLFGPPTMRQLRLLQPNAPGRLEVEASWYIVANHDRTVHPDLDASREAYGRYHLCVDSSHVRCCPTRLVIDVIRAAAKPFKIIATGVRPSLDIPLRANDTGSGSCSHAHTIAIVGVILEIQENAMLIKSAPTSPDSKTPCSSSSIIRSAS